VKWIISEAEQQIGDDARILVRASGIEPLIRIMAEGRDEDKVKKIALNMARDLKNRADC
jgi:phosphoglucosamine mutase